MTHESPHDKAADAVHEGRPVEAQYGHVFVRRRAIVAAVAVHARQPRDTRARRNRLQARGRLFQRARHPIRHEVQHFLAVHADMGIAQHVVSIHRHALKPAVIMACTQEHVLVDGNNIFTELIRTAVLQGETCFAATVIIHCTAACSWLALSLRLSQTGRREGEKKGKMD